MLNDPKPAGTICHCRHIQNEMMRKLDIEMEYNWKTIEQCMANGAIQTKPKKRLQNQFIN